VIQSRTPLSTSSTRASSGTATRSSRPPRVRTGYSSPTRARNRESNASGIWNPPTLIVASTKRTTPGPVGAITTSARMTVLLSTSMEMGPNTARASGGKSLTRPCTRIRRDSTATRMPLWSGMGRAPSRAAK
jgi:hypothetical protein